MFAILVGCLAGGCAAVPRPVVTYRNPLPPRGIVLVADGAGGDADALAALATAVDEARAPLYVRPFDWTHGRGRPVADMTDVAYAQDQGRRLAAEVAAYRSGSPNTPIYLLAYSAGAHVALEAGRWLEPNSLERIVLLAPAVSAEYDLRPALAAALQGVDAFTSERDRLVLGWGSGLVGTADGKRRVPAAGRFGFDPAPGTPADAVLLERLHQHPWVPGLAWTGNTGRHAGSMQPAYFRAYVLPLFSTPDARVISR
jgi:hypothetical protein